ncbi:MAG: zinc metalloprotease HtpX [Candidatus Zixiibacteriota bacterium]|nr:MAG: zinc metalloprotease HtpX [candidate division Zixibacteria bacterium]
MNGIKVALLMMGLMAIFLWIGYRVGGQNGMMMAFALACVINFVGYWFSDKLVLSMYRARQVQEHDHPRLYRVVKEVATINALLPMPKVYLVPSKAPNAFATGRNEYHAAVAVTEGLLEILNDDELKGVIGHEMAHIRNKDILIGTIAATLAGAIGIAAYLARWGAIFGGYGRSDSRGGGIELLIAAIVAPIAAGIIQMAISRQREYQADAEAGRMTGKYRELASALEKLHKAPVRLNLDRRPATAHLMIAKPLSGRGIASLFSTHPPVEKRVERLHKLAQESTYQGYVS